MALLCLDMAMMGSENNHGSKEDWRKIKNRCKCETNSNPLSFDCALKDWNISLFYVLGTLTERNFLHRLTSYSVQERVPSKSTFSELTILLQLNLCLFDDFCYSFSIKLCEKSGERLRKFLYLVCREIKTTPLPFTSCYILVLSL